MTTKAMKHPVLCGMCGVLCGIPCGIKPAWIKACAVCAVSTLTRTGGRVRTKPKHTHHAHACKTHMDTAHTAHTAHPHINQQLTKKLIPHNTPHIPHKKKMDEKQTKRVIRCTPENAPEVRALVGRWPELNHLVRTLQDQNMFPGLRNVQITLTGSEEFVGKGLAGVRPENAPKAE